MQWIDLKEGSVTVVSLKKELVFVRMTGDIINIVFVDKKMKVQRIQIDLNEEVQGDE